MCILKMVTEGFGQRPNLFDLKAQSHYALLCIRRLKLVYDLYIT